MEIGPKHAGEVKLVAAVEGNRVKDETGNTHSLTLTKPVPQGTQSTAINVRLAGSAVTEQTKKAKFKKHAENLKILLADHGAMYMGAASLQLQKDDPNFKRDLGRMTFKQFLDLYPNLFKSQTSAGGGTSRVMLRARS